MVLEICSSITSLHLPGILLAIRNSLLDTVAVSEVQPLASNQDLCYAQGSKRKGVTEDVRTFSVDLPRHNTCSVADSLLETNSSGPAVLWSNVDVQPTHVQSRPVVDSNSAEEGAQELDSVWRWTDD